MQTTRYITYFRVSTARQGRSGMGLEAQRMAVDTFLAGEQAVVLATFTEVESGKHADRPQLAQAMAHCRLTGSTLLIAKLDRLSRDAHFLFGLEKAGINFVATDMPHANRLTIGVMALVAEQEGIAISQRTKDALAAVRIARKEAGLPPLGGYRKGPKPDPAIGLQARQARAVAFRAAVRPTVQALVDQGLPIARIAAELTARQIRTPRKGAWDARAVMKVLAA